MPKGGGKGASAKVSTTYISWSPSHDHHPQVRKSESEELNYRLLRIYHQAAKAAHADEVKSKHQQQAEAVEASKWADGAKGKVMQTILLLI